jgi:multiple sugar transport system ATP-binding protein
MTIRLDDETAGKLAGFDGKPVILGLRPEDLGETSATKVEGYQRLNQIEGTVELVEWLGAETWVHLSTGAHAFVGRAAADSRIEPGQRVSFTFPGQKALFFDPKTELTIR